MRKFVSLVAVALLAGVALAGSVHVPFFLDNAAPGATEGTQSFIGLKNTTSSDILCTVSYRLQDGTDVTPAANTFVLPANSAVAWRPGQNDPDAEGTRGNSVPDMVGTVYNGSATISWAGASTDVQGRVAVIRFSGNTDSSMYTLPSGVD